MSSLIIYSNKKSSVWLGVLISILGLSILYLTSRITNLNSNEAAARGLGLLLFIIGIGAIVFVEDITTTIDPIKKTIDYQMTTRFSSSRRKILFSEVESVRVSRVGHHGSSRTPAYMTSLVLKSKENLRTGRWSILENEIQQLADEMSMMIGCERSGLPQINTSKDAQNFILSLILGVLTWVIYYRLKVGPLCPAMWGGTAPAIVILSSFLSFLHLLRHLSRYQS